MYTLAKDNNNNKPTEKVKQTLSEPTSEWIIINYLRKLCAVCAASSVAAEGKHSKAETMFCVPFGKLAYREKKKKKKKQTTRTKPAVNIKIAFQGSTIQLMAAQQSNYCEVHKSNNIIIIAAAVPAGAKSACLPARNGWAGVWGGSAG